MVRHFSLQNIIITFMSYCLQFVCVFWCYFFLLSCLHLLFAPDRTLVFSVCGMSTAIFFYLTLFFSASMCLSNGTTFYATVFIWLIFIRFLNLNTMCCLFPYFLYQTHRTRPQQQQQFSFSLDLHNEFLVGNSEHKYYIIWSLFLNFLWMHYLFDWFFCSAIVAAWMNINQRQVQIK